ncbi:hypothetical protein GCM10009733_026250 [Nonomuraea maheshkhaliensis]|uniref:Uncharacterized protein n=1 Tax=Nonomuraea maheshkhaliensis TaxID=419590 RepID=A0ABP4QYT7_9ACTN
MTPDLAAAKAASLPDDASNDLDITRCRSLNCVAVADAWISLHAVLAGAEVG